MFVHAVSMRLRILLRNRFFLVWLFWFPIVLSTFFYFTFGSSSSVYQFSPIPTAVVKDEAFLGDAVFQKVLKNADGSFFSIIYCENMAQAKQLLKEDQVSGILSLSASIPTLTVREAESTDVSLLKNFLDEYLSKKGVMEAYLDQNPRDYKGLSFLDMNPDFTEEISLGQPGNLSRFNYYYSLLALVCLYGCFLGFDSIIGLQGNLSYVGARRCVSPSGRFLGLLSELTASLLLNTGCLLASMAYMSFCLNVHFGKNLPALALTCLFGSLTGISFGAFVASIGRFSISLKEAFMMCACMLCSMLGGLVVENTGYLMANYAPVLSYLNPAARISDSFYSLYCYGVTGRCLANILILLGLSLFFLLTAFLNIRRVRYESI